MIWNALLIAETIILIPFLISRTRDPELKKRGEERRKRWGFKWIWMSILAGCAGGLLSYMVVAAIGIDAWIAVWKVILHVANPSLLIYLFFISDWDNPYARLFGRAKEQSGADSPEEPSREPLG